MADNDKTLDFNTPEGKASVLDEIMGSDLRESVLKNISKAHPEVVIPEIRAEEKISKALEDFEKRMQEKLDETFKEREFNSALTTQRQAVADRGFKIEDVEQVMKDRRIGSYETAMAFMEQEKKLAPATPTDFRESFGMNLPKNLAEISKNPKNWARNASLEALNDIKAGRLKH